MICCAFGFCIHANPLLLTSFIARLAFMRNFVLIRPSSPLLFGVKRKQRNHHIKDVPGE